MQKFKKMIKDKWILLDTNILLKASRDPQKFEELFNLIKEANCKLAISQLVRAEFLQSVWDPALINVRENFLKNLNIVDIPMRPLADLTDMVMRITRSLKKQKVPLADLVDSYLIALAELYKPNLIVLTINHKDFAYNLDRFYVKALEISEKEVLTLGFYKAR